MSEPNKYRDWILETIDSLRSRKARPDLERICRMVRRRHGFDSDRTRTELEKLIQEQTVLKVSYKGSISYRNAAKVQRKGRKKGELTSTDPMSNNNGDSAHSFTDPEEGGGNPEPSQKPVLTKPQPDLFSGNSGRINWKEEKASPTKDGDSGRHGAAGCPPPGSAHISGAQHSVGFVVAPRVLGVHTRSKSCISSTSVLQRQKNPSVKSKLKVVGGMNKAVRNHANSDLVVSTLQGGTAVTSGSGQPLGLKDILGYLSSQERLSEEKLTRGNVKVVMEREVARGRLRRTRCGNITLPLQGAMVEDGRDSSDDGVVGSETLDVTKPSSPSRYEIEALETTSEDEEGRGNEEEEEREEEEEEEEEDSRSSDEEGRLSPVAVTTEPSLIYNSSGEIQPSSKVEDPQQHHQGGEGLQCKAEVSVSSCWLTPTASPPDFSLPEEQGFAVVTTELLKSESASGSPIDWTVSDVVRYFTAAGYPEQAVAFRTQEIDGKSLLLMQRNDVLTGLSIKLGPALKIFEHHVKILQKTHYELKDC